jgi:hypothetical protein
MTQRTPFKPHFEQTATVASGAVSANVTVGKGDKSLRLINYGANICYFRTGVGSGTGTATAADCPIIAGQTLVIEKAQEDDTVAHISAAGTILLITPGEGGI